MAQRRLQGWAVQAPGRRLAPGRLVVDAAGQAMATAIHPMRATVAATWGAAVRAPVTAAATMVEGMGVAVETAAVAVTEEVVVEAAEAEVEVVAEEAAEAVEVEAASSANKEAIA